MTYFFRIYFDDNIDCLNRSTQTDVQKEFRKLLLVKLISLRKLII